MVSCALGSLKVEVVAMCEAGVCVAAGGQSNADAITYMFERRLGLLQFSFSFLSLKELNFMILG